MSKTMKFPLTKAQHDNELRAMDPAKIVAEDVSSSAR